MLCQPVPIHIMGPALEPAPLLRRILLKDVDHDNDGNDATLSHCRAAVAAWWNVVVPSLIVVAAVGAVLMDNTTADAKADPPIAGSVCDEDDWCTDFDHDEVGTTRRLVGYC